MRRCMVIDKRYHIYDKAKEKYVFNNIEHHKIGNQK